MNDSTWAKEHTTAAALDGLSSEELLRFESEASAELKQAAEGLRAMDATLRELFVPQAPVKVEVSSVSRLRQEWTRETMERGWRRKLVYGLAASVGIGLVGASVVSMGGLPMPGSNNFSLFTLNAKKSAGERNFRESQSPGSLGDFDGAPVEQSKVAVPTPSQMYEAGRNQTDPFSHAANDSGFHIVTDNSLSLAIDDSQKQSGAANFRKDADEKFNFNRGNVELSRVQTGKELKDINGIAKGYMPPPPPSQPLTTPVEISDSPIPEGLKGRSGSTESLARGEGGTRYAKTEPGKPGQNGFGESKTVNGQAYDVISPLLDKTPILPPVMESLNLKTNAPQTPQAAAAANAPAVARKVIIRSGEIEFEVESFDSSVAGITSLVLKINGAFVSTVNSEKMANGKVKGSVVVRIPPEALDAFVLDLRKDLSKTGELKGQRIGSQDITKQYTDLESRLKAARTMETRLLEMIKNGKGEIKQLLDAEKELGVWRTKIEEYEGELRFYSNQASLSTLTITITEKEIRTAALLTESEKFSAGLEVESVDKAYLALQAAVSELKGHLVKSEMKTHTFGQSASIVFDVPADSTGPMQDRLKQIGNVARMNSDRVQSSDGQPVPRDTKVKRGDTLFDVQLYNISSVRPRETATVQLAVPNVGESFIKLREAVTKANGRVLNANLNEQDKRNVTATIDFEVKRADESQIRTALESAGETVSRNVVRAPEAEVMTDAKVLYRMSLSSADRIPPREKVVLASEVGEVDNVVALLNSYVRDVNGSVLDESSNRDRGKVTTRVIYQVPLTATSGLTEKVKGAGILRVSNSSRDVNAPDGKFALARVEVTLSNEERIVAPEDGIWPQVRKGLSYSATVLLQSVTWVVFGLCVVLPWAIVGYGGYRLMKWLGGSSTTTPAPTTTPTPVV